MEASKLANWLQIGANTGILAGLVLVGFQMQQASDLLRMQLIKDEATSYISTENTILGDNYAAVYQKSIEDPMNMSIAEMRIEETMLWSHSVYRWANTYRLYELGLLEAADWQSEVQMNASFFFSTPYGRAWWDTTYEYWTGVLAEPDNNSYIPEELLEYINDQVGTLPLNRTTDAYDKLKENLKKYLRPEDLDGDSSPN